MLIYFSSINRWTDLSIHRLQEEPPPTPPPLEQSLELEHHWEELPSSLKTSQAALSPLALRGPIPSPKLSKMESPSCLHHVGRNTITFGAS
jgi:hypothetical protein